jgi:hypothetical protein
MTCHKTLPTTHHQQDLLMLCRRAGFQQGLTKPTCLLQQTSQPAKHMSYKENINL